MQSKYVRSAAALALAVALFVLFLWKVNLAEVWRQIVNLDPRYLALSVVASVASLFVRSWRWQVLLEPIQAVPFSASFEATSIGFAASTLLPLRAGEVIRPAVLSRRTGLPFSAALASIVFERMLDLATVLAYFVLYVFWPGARPAMSPAAARHFQWLEWSSAAAALIIAGFTFAAIGALSPGSWLAGIPARMTRLLPLRFRASAERAAASFLRGFTALRHARALATCLAGSAILWLLTYTMIGALIRAFHLALPLAAPILVLLITLVGLALPTPGGVGGFHKACQIALTYFYGVATAAATGLALVYHVVAFLPVTVLGLLYAARMPRATSRGLASLAARDPAE